MTRFLRQATEAGVITPRSGPSPARPRRHPTLARFIGAVGMVSLTVLLFWLLTDPSFRVTERSVRFEGLAYADETAVRAHLAGLDRSPNIFRVRASDIVSDLRDLPEVDRAKATVALPAQVSVHVEERDPIFVWSDGQQAWLVDREGMLFAPAAPGDEVRGRRIVGSDVDAGEDADGGVLDAPAGATDAAGGSATETADALAGRDSSGLPIVEDWRLLEEPPTIGTYLPLEDLVVMRQLLALTPELLGSRTEELWLRVDQLDGYVLQSDRGWQAVFGHYSPTVQPPDVVPRQVQCLRWLLASQERRLERARLALSDEGCGTFTEFSEQG